MKLSKIVLVSTLIFGGSLSAGWQDQIGGILEKAKEFESVAKPSSGGSSTASSLSQGDMTGALKEALSKGVKFAVTDLGKEGGYLNNPLVKIPLPKNLQAAEKILRGVGGDKYVDDLVLSLNKAAEEAAPKTAEVFMDTIQNMSIDDAKGILAGSDDAATQYFKTNSSSKLAAVIAPIVQKSMANNDVAKYYKTFNSFYQQNAAGVLKNDTVSALTGKFGLGEYLPGNNDEDLDSYVTNRSIDGLMMMIAKKEKEIRDNPLMQNSDLLGKVFSAF